MPWEPMFRREPMPYTWVPPQRDGSEARGSTDPGVDSRSASRDDARGDAKGGAGGSASASARASSSGGGNAGASASGSRGGNAGASSSSNGGGNASSGPRTGGGGVWGPQVGPSPPSSPSWTSVPEERDFRNNLIRERLEELQLPAKAVESLVELERHIEDWYEPWYMDPNMDNQAWRAVREGVLEGRGSSGWRCPCGYIGDNFDAWSSHFPWNTKRGHQHAPIKVRDAWIQWYNEGRAVLVHIHWAHFVQPSV